MCLICVDFQKQKMTTLDARRALREMRSGLEEGHANEVEEMILEVERAQKAKERLEANAQIDVDYANKD